MSNYYERQFPSNRNDQTRQNNDRLNNRNMGDISMINNMNKKKRDEINRLDNCYHKKNIILIKF
jgi:hypothetical protein